ncbi:sphingosine 1-phosphate receptor 2-like [Gigantopelta aegis]|uniref:sphingosine 1-phosphate receptor 2-like n=1 Tax=Gigantopelta aegis TaxID=1735272 RepID=UPI001B88BD02|nr:sphingosine 1-phosphate receptor 2-like [Gigantopelta aegis]
MNSTDSLAIPNYVVFHALNGSGITVGYLVFNLTLFLLGVAIILLNVVVADTLIRRRSRWREPTDTFVISLAFTDAVTGVSVLYNAVYHLLIFKDETECLIRYGIHLSILLCNTYHLAAVTMERYVRITSPFVYAKTCRKHINILVCCGIWALSFLLGLLPVMGVGKDFSLNRCILFNVISTSYLGTVLALLWMPFVIMVFLYYHIFTIVRRHTIAIVKNDYTRTLKKRHSTTESIPLKYTKTVCLVTGVYLVCWMPSGLVVLLALLGKMDHMTLGQRGMLLMYSSITIYLNSIINPVIYAFRISTVRYRFRQIFCKRNVTHLQTERTRSAERSNHDC